jgi:hypothetical protein
MGAEAAAHGVSAIGDAAAVWAAQRYVLRFAARRKASKAHPINRGDS